MSASDIIAELPRLRVDELAALQSELEEEIRRRCHGGATEPSGTDFLLQIAGTADGLPPDLAQNHDHYLYGTSRRVGE